MSREGGGESGVVSLITCIDRLEKVRHRRGGEDGVVSLITCIDQL